MAYSFAIVFACAALYRYTFALHRKIALVMSDIASKADEAECMSVLEIVVFNVYQYRMLSMSLDIHHKFCKEHKTESSSSGEGCVMELTVMKGASHDTTSRDSLSNRSTHINRSHSGGEADRNSMSSSEMPAFNPLMVTPLAMETFMFNGEV